MDSLRRDLLDNQTEWENKRLAEFLEALNAYTEDVQGYYENQKLDVDADIPTKIGIHMENERYFHP